MPSQNPVPSRLQKDNQEPWTIRRVLTWAADDFRARGGDSARLDAELLLAEALGTDRIRLILDAMRPLNQDELAAFKELIRRRRTGEPVAYILGRREFYGLELLVDARVLIPRADTEALVEAAIEATAEVPRGRALDLCTGSGCVALAFASRRPDWEVHAADISEAALEVARENGRRLGAAWNLHFHLGDLLTPFSPGDAFDVVTANAPYISASEFAELDIGVRGFEPHLALKGGDDGLDLIGRLVLEAPSHLVPGGLLALEVGYEQAPQVIALFEQSGFDQVRVHHDYGGRARVVSGRRR